MKVTDEGSQPGEAGTTRAAEVSEATPALPSADQHSFNETLREGVRGLGGLVRDRKRRATPAGEDN